MDRSATSAVLLSFVAAICRASAPPTSHQSDLAVHQGHVQYVADFHCHAPQPRIVRLNDLLTPHQTYGKAYFPDVTLLHLCDDSCGSCPPGEYCDVLHAEFVHLPFKVTFLQDFGFHKAGSWAWEQQDVANHTVCACNRHHHQAREGLGSEEGEKLTQDTVKIPRE